MQVTAGAPAPGGTAPSAAALHPPSLPPRCSRDRPSIDITPQLVPHTHNIQHGYQPPGPRIFAARRPLLLCCGLSLLLSFPQGAVYSCFIHHAHTKHISQTQYSLWLAVIYLLYFLRRIHYRDTTTLLYIPVESITTVDSIRMFRRAVSPWHLAPPSSWRVLRMDTYGNTMCIGTHPSRGLADRQVAQLNEVPHKQHYWVDEAAECGDEPKTVPVNYTVYSPPASDRDQEPPQQSRSTTR